MDWEELDDEDFYEFVVFDEVSPFESVAKLYEEKVEQLFCKVNWDTLEQFTNLWNKEQMRVLVIKYNRRIYNDKSVEWIKDKSENYLAMGKRLTKAMKNFHSANPKQKNIRILRIGESFSTDYLVEKCNPDKQATL